MAKLSIVAGATSQSVNIFVQNSSVTTGAGLTGLVYNSSGLIAYYTFAGTNATATAITLATLAAVNSAFSSGGFKEIDATHMPGIYRLDIPNAALAGSSGRSVVIMLTGATNMATVALEIELTGVDNQDAVHFGMTALPNTACTTNASLLTSGTGTDQLSVASGRIDAGKILGTAISTPATAGILDVNIKNMNNVAATAITTVKAVQGLTTADTIATYTGNTVQTGDCYARLGAPAGASVSADIAEIEAETDTLLAGVTVTSVTSAASNIKKNTALANFPFVMTDSTTHAPKTGVTVTATRSLDGAALGACANAVSELSNGVYTINLAATDLNANTVTLRFTGASSDDCDIIIITQP